MLFNSYLFIFAFLPVTILGTYFCARHSVRFAFIWLTIASLIFYGYWNPPYVLLLIASITINFYIGYLISRAIERGLRINATVYLVLGVVFNIALLVYFKYANFFIDTSNAIFGTDWSLEKVLLPIGISFYTFTQIAYLIDCKRGFVKVYKFVDYALFVTFFPQLIAGPILHHKEMMPQFENNKKFRFTSNNVSIGLTIFIIGLFKKAVLADGIAAYSTPVFTAVDSGGTPDLFMAWGGALSYTFQLYFDFSGYSDMAIGLARMFGIILPLNFSSPYKSLNIQQFWRTWHMTLSRFLRDYLYVPLGGNRKGNVRRYINLLLTMTIGGLWHGAGWNFAVWGALHGGYLMINQAWTGLIGKRENPHSRIYCLLAWAVTFVAVVVGWVFFRAQTMEGALSMLKGMSGANGILLPAAIHMRLDAFGGVLSSLGIESALGGGSVFISTWLWVVGLFLLSVLAPNTQQIMHMHQPALDYDSGAEKPYITWSQSTFWSLLVALMAAISILSLTRVSEFLYFQF